jgi:aspartyl-tRNA(Asn)/glutamyl-tRNA(Gln) amidotransferase subunit B
MIEQVRASMPELPAERRERFQRALGLGAYEATILTEDREIADYFESMLEAVNPRTAANWTMTEVLRAINESGKPLGQAAPSAAETGALLRMVQDETISLNAAKTAFAMMCRSGRGAIATVEEMGLVQVSDEAAIAAACEDIITAEPGKVAEYRSGRDKLFGFFVGQVMKAMGGKANPKIVNQVLRQRLAGK